MLGFGKIKEETAVPVLLHFLASGLFTNETPTENEDEDIGSSNGGISFREMIYI